MYQREHDRGTGSGQTARSRRNVHPVLALQRLIGNRGTTRVLARQTNKAQFEHSVKFGKVGPLEIKGGNVKDWVGKDTPDKLELTTTSGKHSDELKRKSESRERIDKLTVSSVVGENTIVVITISNARIKGYAADEAGKTESWEVVDFDAVHRDRTSIGKARP